jgi:hypothetical protein
MNLDNESFTLQRKEIRYQSIYADHHKQWKAAWLLVSRWIHPYLKFDLVSVEHIRHLNPFNQRCHSKVFSKLRQI